MNINRVKYELSRILKEKNIPKGVADWIAVLDDSIGILHCLPTIRHGKCYKSRPCTLPAFRLDGRPIPLMILICRNPWQIVVNFLSLDIPWFARLDMNSFVIDINNTAENGLFTINSNTEINLKLKFVNIGVAKGALKVKGLIRYDCTKPKGAHRWKERAIYNLKAPNFQYNKKFYKLQIRLEIKIRRINWFRFDYVCKHCQNLVNAVKTFGDGPPVCIAETNRYITWHRRILKMKRKKEKGLVTRKRKAQRKIIKVPVERVPTFNKEYSINGKLMHLNQIKKNALFETNLFGQKRKMLHAKQMKSLRTAMRKDRQNHLNTYRVANPNHKLKQKERFAILADRNKAPVFVPNGSNRRNIFLYPEGKKQNSIILKQSKRGKHRNHLIISHKKKWYTKPQFLQIKKKKLQKIKKKVQNQVFYLPVKIVKMRNINSKHYKTQHRKKNNHQKFLLQDHILADTTHYYQTTSLQNHSLVIPYEVGTKSNQDSVSNGFR